MKEVIEKLTNKELLELVEDYKKLVIPEDSIVRRIITEAFGEMNTLVLQMNQLLWPIAIVLSERLKNCYEK